MAADLGPGDWVECIDTDPCHPPHPRAYRTGELCVVEEVGEDESGPWLNCIGKVRPADYGQPEWLGFDVVWFRPIYRPNADFIESLKAPPKSAPRQPTLPTRTPEVVGANSRDEQNLPAHGVGAGV